MTPSYRDSRRGRRAAQEGAVQSGLGVVVGLRPEVVVVVQGLRRRGVPQDGLDRLNLLDVRKLSATAARSGRACPTGSRADVALNLRAGGGVVLGSPHQVPEVVAGGRLSTPGRQSEVCL